TDGHKNNDNDRTKVLQEAIRELEKSRSDLSTALEKEKDLNDLKSRFISMASHEFRTPLTTILSSAGLIAEYNAGETHADRRLKHLDRIRNAVNNLNDILGDFLSLSKLEEGKIRAEYTEFTLPELVREVIGDLHVNTKPGQQILYAHKGRDQVVLDPKLLKNILINLVSNAIKFSPEHKNIRINTEAFDLTIRLEVLDEGIGISEEDQKHLFERFYRGKNAFNIQGTGLGLNIVGNYVDLLKGHISLSSQLDAGTTIKITFPHLIS
ncbi:MAG: sensor histidine kinase, partial [Bacteroidota bacterium]